MTETRRPARTVPIWDAPITVGLLAVGVINTVQAVAQARDLPAVLDRIYQARGISRYTPVDVATGIGWAMAVAAIASLVLAIGFSVPRIRDHRLAFWIPLAAGAASAVVTGLLVTAAILADPTYLDSIQQLPPTP
ncbi:MAG: hypothetical protein JWQ92_637 [Amnibacterium sp.]|nr:hypothetical protein [Amnibacterium sp.]